jgi:hypothetical protein
VFSRYVSKGVLPPTGPELLKQALIIHMLELCYSTVNGFNP